MKPPLPTASALVLLSLALAVACAAPRAGVSGAPEADRVPQARTVAPTPPAPRRPNILWLVAEDLSLLIPPFGDSTIQTPHLSRLAAEGVRYPNVFSVAGVCAPSRAALATGMYPISIGAHHMRTQYAPERLAELGLPEYGAVLPQGVALHAQHLRHAGYYTSNNDKTDYQFQQPRSAFYAWGPRADYHARAPGQPFFSIYNFVVTHESQLWGTDARHYRFRPGFPDSTSLEVGHGTQLAPELVPSIDPDLEVPLPPYLVDDQASRDDLRRVYRNVQTMDEQVGFLLGRLEEDGLLDSTIVVWYTDHGGPLPRQKRLLYDSGLRVPMIVRWPDGYRAGEVDSSLVSFVDFTPTTLAMAGLEVPDVLQGEVTFARTGNATREYVFAASDRLDEVYDRIRGVRDRRYKLLRNYYPERPYYLPLVYREKIPAMQSLLAGNRAGTLTPAQAQWFRQTKDSVELFDTYADPHELKNLAEDPAFAKTRQRLTAALDRHLAEVGDMGHVDERDMVRAWWGGQLDQMPTTATPELVPTPDGHLDLVSPDPAAFLEYCYSTTGDCRDWAPYWGEPLRPVEGQRLVARAHRIGYAPSVVVVK